jgi:hypothetical protein
VHEHVISGKISFCFTHAKPYTMSTLTSRHQRTRTLALTAGMVLGMAASVLAPQLAHARITSASKHTLANNFTPPPEASAEQLQAAERVLTGRYACEFGKSVSVDRSERHAGYFDLKLDRQAWVMKPVVSSTGAVRLEDVKGNALLIQILTKSMVMDPKVGRRLVDGCVHDVQRAAEADLRHSPRPSLFGPSGN